jgi:hypothetical protein
MRRNEPSLVESAPLPYLLALPAGDPPAAGAWPVLCFLHGYGEAAPMPIRKAMTLHSPLHPDASPRAREAFIVVAPQMPAGGDLWHRHADSVRDIVQEVQSLHRGDPQRTFLTGFSYGGNGVLDLALRQPHLWAALWPVDPTRVPEEDPRLPIWLSSGELSRRDRAAFIERLGLETLAGDPPGDRVYEDRGEDHVGTAALAYRDGQIYDWLLSKRQLGLKG